MALETLNDADWGEIWAQSPGIGWCIVDPAEGWAPPPGEAPAPKDGALTFPTGMLALDQLKKRLAAEGLLAPGRKRPLPLLPRSIGIVTSQRAPRPTGSAGSGAASWRSESRSESTARPALASPLAGRLTRISEVPTRNVRPELETQYLKRIAFLLNGDQDVVVVLNERMRLQEKSDEFTCSFEPDKYFKYWKPTTPFYLVLQIFHGDFARVKNAG